MGVARASIKPLCGRACCRPHHVSGYAKDLHMPEGMRYVYVVYVDTDGITWTPGHGLRY